MTRNQIVAKSLLRIAKKLVADEVEMSFQDEIRMTKDFKVVKQFFKDLVKFKGSLNDFVNNLGSMVKNPNALKEFNEAIDFVKLSRFIAENDLMNHAKLNDDQIKVKIKKVYQAD